MFVANHWLLRASRFHDHQDSFRAGLEYLGSRSLCRADSGEGVPHDIASVVHVNYRLRNMQLVDILVEYPCFRGRYTDHSLRGLMDPEILTSLHQFSEI